MDTGTCDAIVIVRRAMSLKLRCPHCLLIHPLIPSLPNVVPREVLSYTFCTLHCACLSCHGHVCWWRAGSRPAHWSALTGTPRGTWPVQERKGIKCVLTTWETPDILVASKHISSFVKILVLALLNRLRKLVLRKVEWSLQGYISTKWQSQDLRQVFRFENLSHGAMTSMNC